MAFQSFHLICHAFPSPPNGWHKTYGISILKLICHSDFPFPNGWHTATGTTCTLPYWSYGSGLPYDTYQRHIPKFLFFSYTGLQHTLLGILAPTWAYGANPGLVFFWDNQQAYSYGPTDISHIQQAYGSQVCYPAVEPTTYTYLHGYAGHCGLTHSYGIFTPTLHFAILFA